MITAFLRTAFLVIGVLLLQSMTALASPWKWEIGAAGGYVRGRSTTSYTHPNPALSNSARFSGTIVDVGTTVTYRLTPDLAVGVAVGVAHAPDLGESAHLEWTQIETVTLARTGAVAEWTPGAGPFVFDAALGITKAFFGGIVAAVRDPDARFRLGDADGVGPHAALGATYLRTLGKDVGLGLSLRASGATLYGTETRTNAWATTIGLQLLL